jgi:flagellar biosynthesis/type III secretory pathway M-ring protein FliF/YscJ
VEVTNAMGGSAGASTVVTVRPAAFSIGNLTATATAALDKALGAFDVDAVGAMIVVVVVVVVVVVMMMMIIMTTTTT